MAGEKTLVLENTARRDALIDIEQKYQKLWADEKLFEHNAPNSPELDSMSVEEMRAKYPKFMASMAYPYMNGVLHAGHAFTLSKVEFAVGYERMRGKRALFPLGYHCTGLPIKASADKLKREIEQFGPLFENFVEDEDETPEAAPATPAAKADPTKFRATKAKAQQKQGRGKHQFEIMLQLGIPREQIQKFSDPYYWIEYFPPLCMQDCQKFGARIDWRRQMVTTDFNPYYDAFVRWQMNTEYKQDKIKFGKRYTIFSAKDNQPCMDHDRQTGEGVNPQEYVGIKIELAKAGPNASAELKAVLAKNKVYLVAATLRPETMYGQTCCFVSSKIDYGVFPTKTPGEFWVCTERAFKNMCFQGLTPERGVYAPELSVKGSELFGSEIHAPLAQYPVLHVLPMETILPSKGTGVVTCVPSDSPDDYVTVMDIRKKPDFYGVAQEWLPPAEVPVLETPLYGVTTAKTLVEELKINSPKDKEKLAQAKEAAYKEGFYNGVVAVGPHKGEKVEEAKPKIRDEMVAAGQAFVYSEPEGLVVSRSGDVCVVSLEDQWYNDYGETKWRAQVEEMIKNVNFFSDEVRRAFEATLGWMKQWALSRTYGLGTKIPWDQQYLVESLSDSTIYHSYYTISHLLHSDVNGHVTGELGVSASELIDEVWDYIFCRRDDVAPEVTIPKEKLDRMRREFRFFYPMDQSISGKDLIGNHLTMYLYCNRAIFGEDFWPKGIRVNGHLMLNGEKMSKSTGNFLTLNQMLTKFGTDASRIALADAGDSTEDANFDESAANAAILRMHNLKEWLEQVFDPKADLRETRQGFFDEAFNAEMDDIIRKTESAYDVCAYRQALKFGLFDLQISRDYYRDVCNSLGLKMSREVVRRYAEVQALLVTPIAPHFADFVWRDLLKHSDSVQNALFPKTSAPESPKQQGLLDAVSYVREVARSVREVEGQLLKKKKKGPVFDAKAPSKLTVYVALQYPDWQNAYIDLIRSQMDSLSFKEMSPEFKKDVGKLGDPKRGMQLVNTLRQQILATPSAGKEILDRKLTFDEVQVIRDTFDTLKLSAMATNVTEVQVVVLENGSGTDVKTNEKVEVPSTKPVNDATPGKPGIAIVNLE